MFLHHEQIAVAAAPQSFSNLNPPEGAYGATLQAETNNVRYVMDPAGTDDLDDTHGMLLLTGLAPEEFLMESMKNIRFVHSAGGDGILHVHWFGGRQVS